MYNFTDLKIPGKRELKIILRRKPEPDHNIDMSNWTTNTIPKNMLNDQWYIDVIP